MHVSLRGFDSNGQGYDFGDLTYPSTHDDITFAINLIKRKYRDIVRIQVDIDIDPTDSFDGVRRPAHAHVASQRNN